MSTKPIKLYSHATGPNPWKVAILLEELGLPYETEWVDFSKIKSEPYINVNVNGRVPAIEDPNTGVTLWESGAIVNYLVETYDKENKLHHTSSPEKYQELQWIMFQMSGQGPYYGQAAWFMRFHHEKLPSAIERYQKEIERVVGVIDSHLSKTGQKYLVGNKCTYADLIFIPWGQIAQMPMFVPELAKNFESGKYTAYQAWFKDITSRPATKKVLDEKAKKMAESQH